MFAQAWHLGRKIKADYIDEPSEDTAVLSDNSTSSSSTTTTTSSTAATAPTAAVAASADGPNNE